MKDFSFFFFVIAKVDFNLMFQGEIGKAVTINPFVTNVPISYPLKTPENFWFSGVFRA